MNTNRRFLTTLTCAVMALFLFTMSAITLSGRAIDSNDKSGLAGATVKLLKANKDSTLVKGVSTDEQGYFKLTDVGQGKYIVSINYIGYKNCNKNITVTKNSGNIKLEDMALEASSIMLKEAVVTGVKTEIVVKEDTVEYNADSYKTQPNAVVEDLLKRLPGVEVDSDGKITANGKEIKKILIDGKEFFADDTKVGTKNIPVNIVDKVQVVDRKSDLARLTGVDDGEDETVINLSVKKGMNNGWFGNVSAGYGTDDRYEANFMINRFSDGDQFTILGGGNNTNNMRFTNGSASRFSRFGGGGGINTNQNIGFNFNVGSKDSEKFRAGGNVMYSHNDQKSTNRNNRQYLFTDSTSFSDSRTINRNESHNVNGRFRIKWEIDSFNTFEFRPNFSFNFNESSKIDSTRTLDGNMRDVNYSFNNDKSDGKSYEFAGQLVYNHKFRSHPGRSFSIQMRYSMSDVNEDGNSLSQNRYYLFDDSLEIINQIDENHRWNNQVNGRITWTEPIGDIKNALFLDIAYRANYRWNNADKLVYDVPYSRSIDYMNDLLSNSSVRNYIRNTYTSYALSNPVLLEQLVADELAMGNPVLNEDDSNRFRNDFFTQTIELGIRKVSSTLNANFGISLNPSMSRSENLINTEKSIPTRWVWNFAPYARVRFKMSKTRSLQLNYRASTSQPSMNQLQPVADKSNPLRIVQGNPDLKPSFTQRLNARYNDFNQEAQRSIMAMISAQYTLNSIISMTDFNNETGGQITTYGNVNGVWNVFAMGMISVPLRNKHFYYSTHLNTRYSSTVGYNNKTFNRSGTFSVNVSPGMTYRTDVVELQLRPNYNLQTTHNTVNTKNDLTVHRYGGWFNGNITLPFGLSFNTDLNFSASKGYTDGYNTEQWLWNASVSYEFLKGRQASITARVYDILGQRKSISRSVTANYIQDSESNSLTRYAMFTFAYKFNTFGSDKNLPQGARNYGGWGPGGGGGGMRRR